MNLPFWVVKNTAFQRTLLMLWENLLIPKRDWVWHLVNSRYETAITAIKAGINSCDSKISLALDGWSHGQLAFMAITGYYINTKWQYHEVLLGFEPLLGQHDGAQLAQTLLRVLEQYNITHWLYAITTDNAANNSTLREALAEVLERKHSIYWNNKTMNIPCMAHVLALAVTAFLKTLELKAANDDTDI